MTAVAWFRTRRARPLQLAPAASWEGVAWVDERFLPLTRGIGEKR